MKMEIECPIQPEGEIVIKSESLFKNYLNNESETENKLKQDSYFTGDLGYIDDYGFLFVTGRKNEMIVTGGKNVNPIEVESVILKYPGIVETAVFPIDDVEWGEIICAAIVTSIKIDPEKIRIFLKNTLSSYKVPKKIFVENILPRTSLGKIERSKLKKKYSGN
jgi:acyl-CoA synthetase (AMP-forming)/AMP-acid ligase II